MSGLAPAVVHKALATVGSQLAVADRVQGLARLGARATQQALDALLRLVPSSALESVRARLTAMWDRIERGGVGRAALGWLFDVPGAQAFVDEQLAAPGREATAMSSAADELLALQDRIARTMQTAGHAVGVIAALAGLASLPIVAAAAPGATPLLAGAVALVLAVVVVLGMDYADTGRLRRRDGVRVIVERGVARP